MREQPFLTNEFVVPERMKAWVLGGPDEIYLVEKPVPEPNVAEVLVRIDSVAICATDLEILRHGVPAKGLPSSSTPLGPATASRSRFTPAVGAARAAGRGCTPPA